MYPTIVVGLCCPYCLYNSWGLETSSRSLMSLPPNLENMVLFLFTLGVTYVLVGFPNWHVSGCLPGASRLGNLTTMYLNQPTTESAKEIVVTTADKKNWKGNLSKQMCPPLYIYAQTRHRERNRRRGDLFPHIRQHSIKLFEIQKKNLPALVAFQSKT